MSVFWAGVGTGAARKRGGGPRAACAEPPAGPLTHPAAPCGPLGPLQPSPGLSPHWPALGSACSYPQASGGWQQGSGSEQSQPPSLGEELAIREPEEFLITRQPLCQELAPASRGAGSSRRLSAPEDLGEVVGGMGLGDAGVSTWVGPCLGVQSVHVAAATCSPEMQGLKASSWDGVLLLTN